ncbi:MAG: FHA domain-containing protein [Myxococcota bacterium]|nr:FHA domain-containing protein [Deltaproteobacteria bacterium]MDQ3337074.1 FHA domain-containing protein [Myxococcota bacterium]
MLRIVVNEEGQPALPGVDLDAPVIVIGSGARANIRLPAVAARDEHVRIEGLRWSEGTTHGSIGDGHVFAIGNYRVRVEPAPAGAPPSPPQRTESLARELMRGLLGTSAEPVLTIERGPGAGNRRTLKPPDSTLVIGRGDDADWVILDEDLSRKHARIRRGWDGTLLSDLDSQNGTRVDGVLVEREAVLRDGARIELGALVLVYSDPAERQLSTPARPLPHVTAPAPVRRTMLPFAIATTIAVLALAALVWILSS